ncbi:His-Xaa-Ser system protein HxsD [Candidatus Falkowbacteria bacterium]|nr:His-Xaa-Ser system protein HxsD [Candidatus Falkowbacteria bacterium]
MKKEKGFAVLLKKNDNLLEFKINPKIYTLNAIYKTAYFFLDKVYIFLDGDPKKEIKVTMKSKSGMGELEKVASEFYNELLNQLLREKVSYTNAKVREFIVAKALYNAVPNEVDELLKEVEEEDWQEDPLGIAKTWEEQQAEKGEKSKKSKKSRPSLTPSLKLRSTKKLRPMKKKGKK